MTSAEMRPAVPRTWTAMRIYVPIGFLCLLIAIAGFWPTYFGPLLAGTPHALPIIHLHAIVFTGWVILVIAQAWLAATRRIALHMKVGKFGMAWGLVVILVGWATAFSRFGDRIHRGQSAGSPGPAVRFR